MPAMPAEEPAPEPDQPMSVDAAALKALAHPLRVRMYELLSDGGPATASQLAARVGESSGTTSYHLRFLARHGFIEDAEQGSKRERWWQVRPGGFRLEGQRFLDDPESARDLRAAGQELWRGYATQLQRWFEAAPTWDQAWISSSVSNTTRVVATAEEMVAMREEVLEVLQRHADALRDREPPADAARVVAQFHLFPVEPIAPEDDDTASG